MSNTPYASPPSQSLRPASSPQPLPYSPPAAYYPAPMYPTPPAFYPPPFVFFAPPRPPGEYTFAGLRWLRSASALGVAYNATAAAFAVVLLYFASLAPAGGLGFNPGLLLATLGFETTAVILGIVTAALGLLGAHNVNKGKLEFGEEHALSVRRGVRGLTAALVLWFVGMLASFFLTFFAVFATGPGFDANAAAERFALIAIVSGMIQVVWVLLLTRGLLDFLEELLTARGRGLVRPYFMLAVGGSALVPVIAAANLALRGGAQAAQQVNPVAGAALSFVYGISIVSIMIYRSMLLEAEKGCKAMIASGRFDPDGGALGIP